MKVSRTNLGAYVEVQELVNKIKTSNNGYHVQELLTEFGDGKDLWRLVLAITVLRVHLMGLVEKMTRPGLSQ